MSLWTRLTVPNQNEEKIAIHHFCAWLSEWQAGVTGFDRLSLMAVFGLQDIASEGGQLDTLKALYQASTDKIEFFAVFKNILYLAEGGLAYTSPNDAIARLTGI